MLYIIKIEILYIFKLLTGSMEDQATTPLATTPQERTPIIASELLREEAYIYNQALAAVRALGLGSPSKACEASPCAAGDEAQSSRSGGGAQSSRFGDGSHVSRSCRDCWRSFSERLKASECPTPRPQKRRWSEVEQFASADASPAPSAPSTRDAKSRN